ncbi:MAG: diguanylate cyclase [Desulfobulbaceae bacterium]|nr:diguanylate cyclase [Desulfobulbaceae bacterium]
MGALSKNRKSSPWKSFAISLLLVILLFVSALFTGIYINSNRALDAELLSRARALYSSITLTRAWVARHGGVYVEKTAGMQSNPYLKNPDKLAADGTVLTKKNPALVTREISEIAENDGVFGFHITSLAPLNPNNKADEFERRALLMFARGEQTEVYVKEGRGGNMYFRYTAPLYVEASCLECHPTEKVGAVRGAVSVSFDIGQTEQAAMVNRILIIVLFVVTLVTFLGIVFRLIAALRQKLEMAEALIRELMVTDELTGLKNRRFICERMNVEFARASRYHRPISYILFDIDFFKRVNDAYGHDGGDEVLRQVAEAAQGLSREADTLGRYGGEEFLVVLPETDMEAARFVADRYQEALSQLQIRLRTGKIVRMTASFGVACADFGRDPALAESDLSATELFTQADAALYRAKENGRNRVEIYT